jgi:hypothetical protein
MGVQYHLNVCRHIVFEEAVEPLGKETPPLNPEFIGAIDVHNGSPDRRERVE